MHMFLFLNPLPPYNLCTRFPNYSSPKRTIETDEEWLQRSITRGQAKGVIPTNGTIYIIDDTELPDDDPNESYFDAWEWVLNSVRVNMPKARGIHMDRIRVVRNAELVKEDITFMRAVEAGDTSAQSTIATKKQVLRDIPQTFDLTTDTPELLKAKWPTELPARE